MLCIQHVIHTKIYRYMQYRYIRRVAIGLNMTRPHYPISKHKKINKKIFLESQLQCVSMWRGCITIAHNTSHNLQRPRDTFTSYTTYLYILDHIFTYILNSILVVVYCTCNSISICHTICKDQRCTEILRLSFQILGTCLMMMLVPALYWC